VRRVRIGMLTPSSNTVLEPVSQAMLAGLPEISLHATRFPVTEIALSEHSDAQFETATILAAAELLAHARVDVIGWNGTSSSWLGFDRDRLLCQAITAKTGIRATSAVLALNEALTVYGAKDFGLVSPYLPAVQARIIANYRALGIDCVAERCLGLQDNFAFAETSDDTIASMVREVAAAQPDAIAVMCTNMAAAPLAAELEGALGVPVFDTVATTLWKCLALAGVEGRRLRSWGRLFDLRAAANTTDG